ncbi:hypothetical protein Glove_115g10 [Diversispora epigaea]|uniref:Protein kinase domain-containing protein n=1 Tax=Diversispora epigaea TaxID=1348612 RepID=A0A397JB50_9GLOM|nr:hypothetical protein Glove_115g10 [Diversispora epigaea]
MVCLECNPNYTGWETWCQPCNSKHFKNDFDKWTSGNAAIDNFIQVVEWIPYDRLEYIKQIAKGGFGTIHLARWIDGLIEKWDTRNQQWKRYDQYVHDVMSIQLKGGYTSIRFYGITQDPETQKYMMVLNYLKELSLNFKRIHQLDIVHHDFHPGNVLVDNFTDSLFSFYITDFGLSKLIEPNLINPEKKIIFGVLPCVTPEVKSIQKDSEIKIQIKKAKEFSPSTNTIASLGYKTHPQAIYNFSSLPKPKNDDELTKFKDY